MAGFGFLVATTALHCFVLPDNESTEILPIELPSPVKIIKQSKENFTLVYVSGEAVIYNYAGQLKSTVDIPG